MSKLSRPEVLAFIALGANLGHAQATVQAAIEAISALPETRLWRASSLYRTAPLEARGPDFINAVVAVLTRLDAPGLLSQLQQIENASGRERSYKNAPRTLDLDLLRFGDATISSPQLQLPHPRMSERAFVLVPLAEIAPQLVSAAQLQEVRSQAIAKIASDGDTG